MKKILFLSLVSFAFFSVSWAHSLRTLDYLRSISGKKTIAGQHNREPNSEPSKWTDSIYASTGKHPGLWSGDFLFQAENIKNRWTMIHEAKKQWEQGSIVQLMLHTCPPLQGEPCSWDGGVLSKMTDLQWTQLITDGTAINNNWKKRLDSIAVYLQYLKDNGVEVLFRPLHEMNQSAFWWGGRPGPNGTSRLYQITHDYLTKTKGLTNLIWVWDMQDIDKSWANYNPGDGYWDVLGFDVYSDGYNQDWYNYAISIAKDKPIAVGECSKLPTANLLQTQSRYVFFMAWAELVFSDNSVPAIKALYNSSNILTRESMDGWKYSCPFHDSLSSIPGKIETENFDECGDGISYHDSDTSNSKGEYRRTGVDIESCSEGGYDITDTKAKEWTAYSVHIDTLGSYMFTARVSSAVTGSAFHLELDGKNISGTITVPNTNGTQNWTSVTAQIPAVFQNSRLLKIVTDSGGYNINYIKFNLVNKAPSVGIISPENNAEFSAPAKITIAVKASDADGKINKVEYYNSTKKLGESLTEPYSFIWENVPAGTYSLIAVATDNDGLSASSDPVSVKVNLEQVPYLGTPFSIPGKIEMENYDLGGEGIAYHDLTNGNKFGVYRNDDVDLESCTDEGGGYSLGDFQAGEWVEYTVDVKQTAKYNIDFRVATQMTGLSISLDLDGQPLTGVVNVPNTGGWQKWQTISKSGVPLTEGQKVLRVNCFNDYPNINWINFSVSADVSDESSVPQKFSLSQNYPNPFNPSTNIKYALPKNCFVSIKIFDSLGREVKTLLNDERRAGHYSLNFDGQGLSSGLYYYKIQAGEFSQTKKMILLK